MKPEPSDSNLKFAELVAKGLLRRPIEIAAVRHEPMNK